MKKKSIVCLLLALNLMSVTAIADVQQDVIDAQNKYAEYQSSVDEATASVIKMNSEIETLLSNIESAEGDLEDLNALISNNEIQIKTLQEEIDHTEKIKGKRLREYYKTNGNLDYISIIFDSEGFSDFLDRLTVVTKLMKIDKETIDTLEADKKELNTLVEEQEQAKESVKNLLVSLESDKEAVETKKVEQEAALEKLKEEQANFGSEVLEVAEINLLNAQVEVINNSSSSISDLRSAVTQLESIRDNQLTMNGSIEKANSLIYEANDKIAYLEEQERLEQERLEQERLEAEQQQEQISPDNGGYNDNISSDESINDSSNDSVSGSVSASGLVDYAYSFIGLPYVWGAVGPDSFDCSGFTSYVYRNYAGIEISRTTYTQINVGTPVSYSEMQPGDLVFTYNNEHVGIYVGGGMYINATYPGSTIRVTPVTNFYAARRVL